jgi:hypothetical protein
MKQILATVALVLALASAAAAQGSVDAEALYLGPYGGTICPVSTGSGAPTGASTCSHYIDTSTGDLYGKQAGTWKKINTYGTVTSVAITGPTGITWTSSPVTTSGTLTGAIASGYFLPNAGTSGQILRSAGASAPGWSTATFASTYTQGDLLYANTADGIVGLPASSTPGTFLRSAPPLPQWSTLVLPNAATANQVVRATSANTWGGDTGLTYNGTTLQVTGNIGVGTGSANYTLVLSKASVPGIQWLDSATGTGTSSGFTIALSTGDVFLNQRENKSLFFYDNGAEAFAITPSRDLGPSTYASQTTDWRMTRNGSLDVRYLYTDELRAKLFTADLESVLAGSQRVTKSFSTVSQTFTCPVPTATSTLWVLDAPTFGDAAIFVSGDAVVLHAMTRTTFGPFTIADCVGVVTSYTDGTGVNAGQQSWTFTRNGGGPSNQGSMTGGTTIAVNQLVQDMGVSGNGYVETTAIDGAAGINAPYTQVVTWTTAPTAANTTTRCRLGNLNGITSVAEYGLLCGSFGGNAFVRFSDQNAEIRGIPLKLYNGGTNVISIAPNGTSPYISLGSPPPAAFSEFGTVAGIFLQYSSATSKARMYLWADANNYLKYDGSVLSWKAANTTLDASGNLTAASATLSGAITATSGSIAGAFTIGTSGSLASGATAYGTGTGIWAAYNGGTPQFRAGNPSGNRLDWSGSVLVVKSNTVNIDGTNGIQVAPYQGFLGDPAGIAPVANGFNFGPYGYTATGFVGMRGAEYPTGNLHEVTLTAESAGSSIATAANASVAAISQDASNNRQVASIYLQTTGATPASAMITLRARNYGFSDVIGGLGGASFTFQGHVGIGAITTHLLEITGADDAVKPTTATWTIASDARVKTQVRPASDALAVIRQVQIHAFTYTGEYGTAAGVHGLGPIAQEIAPLFPGSVSTALLSRTPGAPADPILLFNPHELWMETTQAVIELDRDVQALKAALAALKAKQQ